MNSKPLPPHGTYARANGSPGIRPRCTCQPCNVVWRRTRKHAAANRQLGRPSIVNATPTRERLTLLRQTMTWQQIADAAGCMRTTLQDVLSGKSQVVRRRTAAAVMAIPFQAPTEPRLYVNATGCRRRLQALAILGHSLRVIAKQADTTDVRIQLVQSGRQPTLSHSLALRITAAYDVLVDTPAQSGASSTLTRRHANAKRWLGPTWWDVDEIDDPSHEPATERTPRYIALAEDCAELERQDLTRQQIAERLGVTRDGLQRALYLYKQKQVEAA
ncbi:hypothetical protein ABTX80_24965 [Streptomyces erythrochromogenes]|uniref:hypothetical protein n=1 Tax=Streptomyces erythrochromogenes TaxID=285574 RepID=UPI003331FC88